MVSKRFPGFKNAINYAQNRMERGGARGGDERDAPRSLYQVICLD